MDMSRAALFQHLKALEQQLNVRLLHRTTRDMSLTEEGQRLFDAIVPALRTIDVAVSELGETQSEPTGLTRINASRIAARTLLEPHMGELMTRWPSLRLELMLNDGFANIIAAGADVGIRLGESLDENMVAVPSAPVSKWP